MTEPFASDAENRDTGEAGSGEPTPKSPAPRALPQPARPSFRSAKPPSLGTRDRCSGENAMPDGLRWSWGGDPSTGERLQRQMRLRALAAPQPLLCGLAPSRPPSAARGEGILALDAPVGLITALGCGPVLREFPVQQGEADR